ncbi:uncharacterized protein LOC122567056 [Bombus pyrosoma]|uniref:uncharacterized protein LOC122567056 n=1 Tax=Bombus pyrosoma TaxID=396416 RepID=UPI001CB8F3D6|nr:uncharacterized protein LOC122567056 [Bombus pyrosoma]
MSTEDGRPSTPAGSGVIDETGHGGNRRMSHFKEYKFFRSFSAKVENWPMRKAEALWRRMRERKIAGSSNHHKIVSKGASLQRWGRCTICIFMGLRTRGLSTFKVDCISTRSLRDENREKCQVSVHASTGAFLSRDSYEIS